MKEQRAIAGRDQAVCGCDQPEHMPLLARTLPYRSGKRAMAAKDESEGEVARGGASLQRVMDSQELGVAIALKAGRKCGQFGCNAAAVRHPLKAGSCGEPQGTGWIARDRECRNMKKRRMAHAQAQSCGAMGDNEVALRLGRCLD